MQRSISLPLSLSLSLSGVLRYPSSSHLCFAGVLFHQDSLAVIDQFISGSATDKWSDLNLHLQSSMPESELCFTYSRNSSKTFAFQTWNLETWSWQSPKNPKLWAEAASPSPPKKWKRWIERLPWCRHLAALLVSLSVYMLVSAQPCLLPFSSVSSIEGSHSLFQPQLTWWPQENTWSFHMVSLPTYVLNLKMNNWTATSCSTNHHLESQMVSHSCFVPRCLV